MWQKLLRHKYALAIVAGILTFLAFPRWELVPTVLGLPVFLNLLTLRCRTFRSGFLFGFLCSFVVMLGGFYWVTYVIHVFGYLPWSVAILLYLGFCGFGALNFPIFAGVASVIHDRFKPHLRHSPIPELWFAIGLPALFTLIEFVVPKLFPWSISHSLYRTLWTNQIAELAGSSFLTFALYSLGSVLGVTIWGKSANLPRLKTKVWCIPLALWTLTIGFSLYRLLGPQPTHKPLQVALVQANIGSLEKVAARRGDRSRVEHVVKTYEDLTESALKHHPAPQLIVWPETAMPFQLMLESEYPARIRNDVLRWNVPLITGGYAPDLATFNVYNAAYLLEPMPDKTLRSDVYLKNILLAFGEYMPFGETFPALYKLFPEVSNFSRGKTQNAFTLRDGTKLGVTVCYEAIVPSFYRQVAANGVQAIVNLTNDSWFGPTAEPYLHGALTIFRAIETRVPLLRVTNTGISFVVDDRGRMSEHTGVYEEGLLETSILLPVDSPVTLYMLWGDWFVLVCAGILILLSVIIFRKRHAPLPF